MNIDDWCYMQFNSMSVAKNKYFTKLLTYLLMLLESKYLILLESKYGFYNWWCGMKHVDILQQQILTAHMNLSEKIINSEIIASQIGTDDIENIVNLR